MQREHLERIIHTLRSADKLLAACKPLLEALAGRYAYVSNSGEWVCVHCRAEARDLPSAGQTLADVLTYSTHCPVVAARYILALDNPSAKTSEDHPPAMIPRLLLACVVTSYIAFLWWFTYDSFHIGPPPHDSVGAFLWTFFMGSVLLGALYYIWKWKP